MQTIFLKTFKSVAAICLLFSLSGLLQSCNASKGYAQGSIDGYHETSSGPSYPEDSPTGSDYSYNVALIFMGYPDPPESYRSSHSSGYIIKGGDIVYAANDLDPVYLANTANAATNLKSTSTTAYNLMNHLTYMGGLEFIKKKSGDDGTTSTLNYLEVPIYGIYQTPFLSGDVFGGIGPYLAYGIGGSNSATFNNRTTSISSFDSTTGFKRFDAGLNLTAGYRMFDSFYFNLVYSRGIANIDRNAFGDKTRNSGFSLNVGYPISKLVKLVHK